MSAAVYRKLLITTGSCRLCAVTPHLQAAPEPRQLWKTCTHSHRAEAAGESNPHIWWGNETNTKYWCCLRVKHVFSAFINNKKILSGSDSCPIPQHVPFNTRTKTRQHLICGIYRTTELPLYSIENCLLLNKCNMDGVVLWRGEWIQAWWKQTAQNVIIVIL